MVRGGTQTDHLVHLAGLVSEMVQNCNKTAHLERLRGLGSEMVRNDTKTIRLFKQHPTWIVNSRPLSTTPSEVWALQASFNNPFRGLEPSRPLQTTPSEGPA